MTTALLSPYDRGHVVELGRRIYRKQVLRKGTIDYKGRRITFDDQYLTDLANAFKAGAYDVVPFQLADADNTHTHDPERTRGTVLGLELTDDGLDMLVELTEDGAKVVNANPRLGVSARIVEGLERADGKRFPRAIQHVLGTLDPRVTGMRPWEAVTLASDQNIPVVDLTAATYRGEVMPKPLTEEEIEGLRKLLADSNGDKPTGDDTRNDAHTEPAGDAERDEPTGEVTDDELDKLIEDINAEVDREPEPATALSADAQKAIDLANARAEEAASKTEVLRRELARERWTQRRRALAEKGVPPAMLDLAQPLLEQPDPTVIELANGKVDATDIVNKLLEQAAGFVDLSRELGHAVDAGEDAQAAERAEKLKVWEQTYPMAG